MNRQKLVLFILLVLLVLAVGYAYLRTPQQKTVERLKYAPGVTSVRTPVGAAPKSVDTKLHLELLDTKTVTFSGFKRNIFWLPPLQSKVKIPPPPPPPKPPSQPQPPPPTPEQTAAKRDQEEMAKFTFLGFLKKDNRKTVFLSKNNEIFIVRKGDTFAGRFHVADVTDDHLTIKSDAGQVVIPLVENMPLLLRK